MIVSWKMADYFAIRGMLDDQTKRLMVAIGLDVNNPGGARQPEPEPEPEPGAAGVAGTLGVGAAGDAAAAALEKSCLEAVNTAQLLAQQLLAMTDRWVEAME